MFEFYCILVKYGAGKTVSCLGKEDDEEEENLKKNPKDFQLSGWKYCRADVAAWLIVQFECISRHIHPPYMVTIDQFSMLSANEKKTTTSNDKQ